MKPLFDRRCGAFSARALLVAAIALAFAGGLLAPQSNGAAAKPKAKQHAVRTRKKPKTQTVAAQAPPPGDLAVTLATFPAGAVVMRAGKSLAGVHAGSSAQQGDTITNRGKKSLDLTISGLSRLRLRPGASLDLTRLLSKRTSAGDQQLDVALKLERGQLLIRLRPLLGQQSFRLEAPGATTAPRGTGYAIVSNGSKAKIVVAEGHVASWLPGYPDNSLVIPPNQMATFDGNVPPSPEDITDAERPLIAEILRLQWQGQSPAAQQKPPAVVQRGPQPGDVLISSVDTNPIGIVGTNHGAGYGVPYTIPWKRKPTNSVGYDGTTIWAADVKGRRHAVARNAMLEALSPDGKTIYASKPNKGLWAYSLAGSSVRQITDKPVGFCRPINGGGGFIAKLGWKLWTNAIHPERPPKWVVDFAAPWVFVPSGGGECLTIADGRLWVEAWWRRRGTTLLVLTTDYSARPYRTEVTAVNKDGSGRRTVARSTGATSFEIVVPDHAPIRIDGAPGRSPADGFSNSLQWFAAVGPQDNVTLYNLADGSAKPLGPGTALAWLPDDSGVVTLRPAADGAVLCSIWPIDGPGPTIDVHMDVSGSAFRNNRVAVGKDLLAWAEQKSSALCLLSTKHPDRVLQTNQVIPSTWNGVLWVSPPLKFSENGDALLVGWKGEKVIHLNLAKLDKL